MLGGRAGTGLVVGWSAGFTSELGHVEIAASDHWPGAEQAFLYTLDQTVFAEPTHRKALASRALSQLIVHPKEIK